MDALSTLQSRASCVMKYITAASSVVFADMCFVLYVHRSDLQLTDRLALLFRQMVSYVSAIYKLVIVSNWLALVLPM